MVSIFTFLPEYSSDRVEPETAPRVAVGAFSPLWAVFGGAAAAGAAYWWWASRWREAVNLEAIMALAPEPVAPLVEADAPEPIPEPVIAPVVIEAEAEPVVEAVAAPLEAAQDADESVAEPAADAIAAANEDAVEAAVEPAAEAVDETVQDVAAPAGDDLTRLVGVGPKLAASLSELGVTTFSQIAAWTPDELASFDQLLNLKGRAERDAWIAQAKRFVTSV
jgi:predicted flap endonuclease-1-like 5' DNA nuclease